MANLRSKSLISGFDADHTELFFVRGLDLISRTLYLGANDGNKEADGEINEGLASTTIKSLLLLNQLDATAPITILLNSPGGDVEQGFAIYDVIRALPNLVTITAVGGCHSMAAAILQAADTRLITKHASLLIHDGTSAVESYNRGTRKAHNEMADLHDKWYEDILLAALKERDPAFSRQKLQNWLAKDTIFTAEKAVELGLADGIVENFPLSGT